MNPLVLMLIAFVLSTTMSAQNLNQEIKLDKKVPFLVGQITEEGLSTRTYKNWFLPNLKNYETNTALISALKDKLSEYKILLFMGTWCGDSKREVPRFLKILKQVNFPIKNLKIIAVDKRKGQYKKSPQGEEWALDIRRVPTFIFYENGKEINRIVESPINTLEEDIMTIISKKPYMPNYSKSLHFD